LLVHCVLLPRAVWLFLPLSLWTRTLAENYRRAYKKHDLSILNKSTLNYICQRLFYRLNVLHICTTSNYTLITLVFAYQPHVLQQMESPFYTNNLPHITVCTMHKWMAQKANPTCVAALGSYIWFYLPCDGLRFLQRCRHFRDFSAPNGH
jgi:hypothetical protein